MFLAGWHDHDELPDIFSASDVVVLPSVREHFGQVLVEGMACGLPAIAVAAQGPGEIIEDGQTEWLVPPDDDDALAAALVMAVNDTHERRRARATVGRSWDQRWPASRKRCWVCLPLPDREFPSMSSPHSNRTMRGVFPISTLFSLVISLAGIVRGKMSDPSIVSEKQI